MSSDTVHVVVYDTRTPVGVAQLIDSMWLGAGKARARVRNINDHPVEFPNMVAWVEPRKVFGGQLVEIRDRTSRGSANGAAKLTEDNVREARRLRREGASTVYLAKTYRVSRKSMSDALMGRTWAHVI